MKDCRSDLEFNVRILQSVLSPHRSVRRRRRASRGQSMVEMALTFPVLLLLLAGAVEIGMYYNTYLNLMDAAREAARYSVNGSPSSHDDNANCSSASGTQDYFRKAGCLARQNVELSMPGKFDPTRDDIIVSVVLFKHNAFLARYINSLLQSGEEGWSWCESMAVPVDGVASCTRAASRFSSTFLLSRLSEFVTDRSVAPGAVPNSAYVLIEIYHVHHQFLGLIPPGIPFIPQEVVMHAYAIMPVPAAASAIE